MLQLVGHPTTQKRQRGAVLSQHEQYSTERHDNSIDSNGQTGPLSANELQEDSLFENSRAAFKVYRPECKTIPDPLTYREAVKKYRKKNGSIDDRGQIGQPL